MCDLTIIFNKNKKEIPSSFITKVALNSADYNKDGTGILIHDGHDIHVWKSLKPYNEIKKLEKWLKQYPNPLLVAVHSRIATQGCVVEKNIHPLTKDGKNFVLHNGIISNSDERVDSMELLKNHYKINGYANFIKTSVGSKNVMFGVQTRGTEMFKNKDDVMIYTTRKEVFSNVPRYKTYSQYYFGKIYEDEEYIDNSGFEDEWTKFEIKANKRWKINLETYDFKEYEFKPVGKADEKLVAKTEGKWGEDTKGLSNKYWDKKHEPYKLTEEDLKYMTTQEIEDYYDEMAEYYSSEEIDEEKEWEAYNGCAYY